jgi:hypothetical protein
LPYHAMGEHKWTAIGKEARLFSVPSEDDLAEFRKIFCLCTERREF